MRNAKTLETAWLFRLEWSMGGFYEEIYISQKQNAMLRRCAFPAWHFLWFWICFLIRSQLVCVVSISISCISDLILTCSRIQKNGISATFQIFSKKKKVPKNQHFFIYYPCFLDINTTHSTCNDTSILMSAFSLNCPYNPTE